MPKLPDSPSPAAVETHFRGLLDDQGLAQPDEIHHDLEAAEVVFIWHEPKLAVVIELGPGGHVDVREAVASDEAPV